MGTRFCRGPWADKSVYPSRSIGPRVNILIDEKREAIQYKKDEEQGMTKTGTKGDDENRTAVVADGKS